MNQSAPTEVRITQSRGDFDGFYRGEHVALFRFLLLITGSRVEAEDVAHDAFVKLLERWARVSAMEAPRPYLYRTALNLQRNSLRRAARRARRAIWEREAVEDFAPSVIERAEVIRMLSRLPRAQREALVLVEVVGMTAGEAGTALGIDADAVRARVHRARVKAREELGDA